MNKKLISILWLVFVPLASLACLESAAVSNQPSAISTQPSMINTQALASSTTQPTLTKTPTAVDDQRTCAQVIAIEALHLRAEPNEHAEILTWLKYGDQVQVISRSNVDWWLVHVGELVGYARSIYLEESECE